MTQQSALSDNDPWVVAARVRYPEILKAPEGYVSIREIHWGEFVWTWVANGARQWRIGWAK